MYEPLAAMIIRRLTDEVATSALPDAPVRTAATEPAPRGRAVAPRLRRRSATLLVGHAGRLYPDLRGPADTPDGTGFGATK